MVVLSGLENYPLGSNNEVTRLMALFSRSECFLGWEGTAFLSVSFKDLGYPPPPPSGKWGYTGPSQEELHNSVQVIVPMATRHPLPYPHTSRAGIPGRLYVRQAGVPWSRYAEGAQEGRKEAACKLRPSKMEPRPALFPSPPRPHFLHQASSLHRHGHFLTLAPFLRCSPVAFLWALT